MAMKDEGLYLPAEMSVLARFKRFFEVKTAEEILIDG